MVFYCKSNGKVRYTDKVGGIGHIRKKIFFINNEYLTEVKGNHLEGELTNITFISNLNNIFGPYGKNNGLVGTPFHLKGEKIVGFYGTTIGRKYISKIGSYFAFFQIGSTMCTGTWPFKPLELPFGGIPFDHKHHESIKTISIHCVEDVLCYFDVKYRNNGVLSWVITSEKVILKSDNPKKIVLDDDEYLTEVEGRYYYFLVYSLTFFSDKGNTFGPYGKEGFRYPPLSFHLKAGKIVGFHGIQGSFALRSIGFHIAPVESSGKSSIKMSTQTKLNIENPFAHNYIPKTIPKS